MQPTKNPPTGGHKSFTARHSTTPPTEPPDFAQAALHATPPLEEVCYA